MHDAKLKASACSSSAALKINICLGIINESFNEAIFTQHSDEGECRSASERKCISTASIYFTRGDHFQ